jgi:hypothetical protein
MKKTGWKGQISVELRSFMGIEDTELQIAFGESDLMRAAIGAGRNWRRRASGTTAFDTEARTNGIRSIVVFGPGVNISASRFYRELGCTEKGTKSFQLANAICALIAYKQLKIPWLVDVERLSGRYQVDFDSGNRRADFIGRSPSGDWYAFESKGRCRPPSPPEVREWKRQARTIKRVNKKDVTNNIVSATYIDANNEIRAIWEDPPGGGSSIEFPDLTFFRAYYEGVYNFLDSGQQLLKTPEAELKHFPALGIFVGIHQQIDAALRDGDVETVVAFAHTQNALNRLQIPFDDQGMKVFADGIVIKMDPAWKHSETKS